jgi:hypothetical protein
VKKYEFKMPNTVFDFEIFIVEKLEGNMELPLRQ